MQYQEESFYDVVDEIRPLLDEHWEEIALNREKIALEPDWAIYEQMHQAEALSITTARDGDRLVGYAIYFLVPNMHYRDWPVADGDIFWLHPDYRKGSTGLRLLRTAEQKVRARGARFILNKVKLHKDVGRVFEHLGYKPIERVYAKVV